MSAKTSGMANGGGAGEALRMTASWTDAHFEGGEASRCHTACAAPQPRASVLVASRDGRMVLRTALLVLAANRGEKYLLL